MATRSIVPRADGEGSIGTPAKKWGTIHAKNILTSDAAAHNSLYRGQEIIDSWATIQANIQAGNFENYYIGDYKEITLTTNEKVIMEIAGINCYKGWSGTAIPNHIDFISRDCLATAYKFNTTNTNNGISSDNAYPWNSSALFQSLNADDGSGVKSTLPSDLRSVYISKSAYLEKRYSSGGAVSADTGAAWISASLLWIPSEVEVFGHATWSEVGYGTAGFQQYPIFRLNPSKIIKGAGNGGVRTSWWTLSACNGKSTHFCTQGGSGFASKLSALDSTRIPLCCRIA